MADMDNAISNSNFEHEFKWESSVPSSVIVTGTFDEWKSSLSLTKLDSGKFSGKVRLPYQEKVLYKYVIDGSWQENPMEPTEMDPAGNVNNVLVARELPLPPPPTPSKPSSVHDGTILDEQSSATTTVSASSDQEPPSLPSKSSLENVNSPPPVPSKADAEPTTTIPMTTTTSADPVSNVLNALSGAATAAISTISDGTIPASVPLQDSEPAPTSEKAAQGVPGGIPPTPLVVDVADPTLDKNVQPEAESDVPEVETPKLATSSTVPQVETAEAVPSTTKQDVDEVVEEKTGAIPTSLEPENPPEPVSTPAPGAPLAAVAVSEGENGIVAEAEKQLEVEKEEGNVEPKILVNGVNGIHEEKKEPEDKPPALSEEPATLGDQSNKDDRPFANIVNKSDLEETNQATAGEPSTPKKTEVEKPASIAGTANTDNTTATTPNNNPKDSKGSVSKRSSRFPSMLFGGSVRSKQSPLSASESGGLPFGSEKNKSRSTMNLNGNGREGGHEKDATSATGTEEEPTTPTKSTRSHASGFKEAEGKERKRKTSLFQRVKGAITPGKKTTA